MGGPEANAAAPIRSTWRRMALVFSYGILVFLSYPGLLIIAQDFPAIPDFRFSRYLSPGELTTYAWFIIASIFIVVCVWGLTQFIKDGKPQFFKATVILCIVFHFVGAYIVAVWSETASPSLLALSTQNNIMIVSIGASAHIGRLVVFYAFGIYVLGRTASGPDSTPFGGLISIAFLYLLLLPIAAYPIVLVVAATFPDVPEISMDTFFQLTRTPFFSYRLQLLALGSLMMFMGAVTLCIIRVKRIQFFAAATSLSYFMYNAVVYIQMHVDKALGAINMKGDVCGHTDISRCLLFVEHGWMFSLCALCSLLVVAQLFKYFGQPKLFRF
jgi:hypothetical protein